MEPHLKHGAFSWNELATSDVEGAKKFYGAIFGWEFEARDMGQMVYHIAKVGDRGLGGMMNACPGQPAMWGSYVTVDNVDETVKLVTELGGKILMGPHDIPEVGRMVMIQDPQGVVISAITYVRRDCAPGS